MSICRCGLSFSRGGRCCAIPLETTNELPGAGAEFSSSAWPLGPHFDLAVFEINEGVSVTAELRDVAD